jgi:predicted DNA-binding transcriptional regulator AlpA
MLRVPRSHSVVSGAHDDDDTLVSSAEVAAMAGVSPSAVSNWRRRHSDFPSPVLETSTTVLFRLGDITRWMTLRGKRFDPRSIEQLVWGTLHETRNFTLLEDAAELGMVVVGFAALASQLGGTATARLEEALGHDDLRGLQLWADQASRVGWVEHYIAEAELRGWPDCGSFLRPESASSGATRVVKWG